MCNLGLALSTVKTSLCDTVSVWPVQWSCGTLELGSVGEPSVYFTYNPVGSPRPGQGPRLTAAKGAQPIVDLQS